MSTTVIELEDIYKILGEATTAYQQAVDRTIKAKNTLENLRLVKVATGEVTGKNEDERKAKTVELLSEEFDLVKSCEATERACKLAYDLACQRLDHFKLKVKAIELAGIDDREVSYD